jgi:hypothetical protein
MATGDEAWQRLAAMKAAFAANKKLIFGIVGIIVVGLVLTEYVF